MKELRTAWAIETGEGKYNGFIGIGRFGWQTTPLPWQNGFRLAIFSTRKQARAHLPVVKGPAMSGLYPKARVVRVEVEIRTAPKKRPGTKSK